MYDKIMEAVRPHGCVLAVVGFIHLGVLARMLEEHIDVDAFIFTVPLVVDETRT